MNAIKTPTATGIVGAALRALLALAIHTGCRAEAKEQTVPREDEIWVDPSALASGRAEVIEARVQTLAQPLVVGGHLAFDDQHVTHVFSPVTGRITRALARLGQAVDKGTPLAAIASPDVGSAFSDEVKARADLKAAEHDYQRQQRLFAEKAASSRDFENAENNYRKAKAEKERALKRRSLLSAADLDVVTQEYTLRSPIAGRVIARNINPGAEVQGQFSGGSAAELFTIGDTESLWLYADVAETELPKVRVGDAITARVIAYPQRVFSGKVEQVASTLDPVLRTARVRCALPNPDGLLKPEMYATVAIEGMRAPMLTLPGGAIVRIGDPWFAYVAAGTRPDGRQVFRRRRVWLFQTSQPPSEAEPVAVLAGLEPGDRVLIDHARKSKPADDTVVLAGPQLAKIATTSVVERSVADRIVVGGRLAFDDLRVTHVFSPVGGRITKIFALPGQHVKRGAALAILASPDLGSAVSDELKAKADLDAAAKEVARQKDMFALHASAERDLEAAQDNYDRAKAELQRTEQKNRLLRRGSVDQVSQEFVLRSPIEGDVVARFANPGLEVQGQYAGGSAPELFTVGNTDVLWFLGDLYEVDLHGAKRGAEVDVALAAFPDRNFHGSVDWISDTLDPSTRTARVRCVLANPEGKLRPEMFGLAKIVAASERQPTVPRDAVVRAGDQTVVFVAGPAAAGGGQVFRRVPVVVNDQLLGDVVPVSSGLRPGDRVVSRGAILLFGASWADSRDS